MSVSFDWLTMNNESRNKCRRGKNGNNDITLCPRGAGIESYTRICRRE
jgi:hypothetical protein